MCNNDEDKRMTEQNSFSFLLSPLPRYKFIHWNDISIDLNVFSLYVFRLSQHCRNLFFDLGSANIQNLKYRDVWAFLGQKGIKGFSPYEEVCQSVLFKQHRLAKYPLSLSTNCHVF